MFKTIQVEIKYGYRPVHIWGTIKIYRLNYSRTGLEILEYKRVAYNNNADDYRTKVLFKIGKW